MQDFIKINKDDNVAVALKPIAKGTTLNVAGIDVTTVEDIPQLRLSRMVIRLSNMVSESDLHRLIFQLEHGFILIT